MRAPGLESPRISLSAGATKIIFMSGQIQNKGPGGHTAADLRGGRAMRIVAVTACPAGIAHTYMAAEQLEQAARKLGHHIRVEVQGAAGTENPLSQAEVDGADIVVIAADIPIENDERFARCHSVTRIPMHVALKNPGAEFAKFERSRMHGIPQASPVPPSPSASAP